MYYCQIRKMVNFRLAENLYYTLFYYYFDKINNYNNVSLAIRNNM